MLCDFNNKTLCYNSSKITSVKEFLDQLNKARKAGNYGQLRDLAAGYIQREVLPINNVYMAKVCTNHKFHYVYFC